MKVAVTGGHGYNLSPCRSVVALRILVRATMMLCLFITDLTCLHVHYLGSCRRPVLKLLMGPFVMPHFWYLWQYLPIS